VDRDTGELLTGPLGVDPRWNRGITPYWWDDSQTCLAAGTTEMWVRGHGFGFQVGDPQLSTTGTALLIDTAAASPADPPTRQIVHLTGAVPERDNLLGVDVTHLSWDATEALTAAHDLTRTTLAGNLVPAVEGRRFAERFVIDPDPTSLDAPRAAVTRTGPDVGCGDASPIHLHTLEQGRLAWLGRDDAVIPELCVVELPAEAGDLPRTWRWRHSLLDADAFEAAYTIDPVAYRDLRTDRTQGLPWFEYDGDEADSVRFGDGSFGARPPSGTTYEVVYRVTAGALGNVAADSITKVPHEWSSVVLRASNPFIAVGGLDKESIEHVRASAPQDFRARQFRAVRAEDYDRAARELAWVLDSGTAMRWTGSWLTVFNTAQPAGHPEPTTAERTQLIHLLGRRHIAGYEVYTAEPRHVGLDLLVTVCAHAWALRGEVAAAVLAELGTEPMGDGHLGFFAPGRWRFGRPLERSLLEAAVQRANGVEGVLRIDYRRRGYVPDLVPMPEVVTVAPDEIIRVDNDPSMPDHGSVRVVVEGGK
jgi:predicted phage baseplate assembly protein